MDDLHMDIIISLLYIQFSGCSQYSLQHISGPVLYSVYFKLEG
jgi:hypothetical protein